jgi:hypothetical protein
MLLPFKRTLFLTLLTTLFSTIAAVPYFGITSDYDSNIQESLQSYSGIIEFSDKSIPGDKDKLSDGQFRNLAKVAYAEMIQIWEAAEIESRFCPGAMIALESEGRIYFASSIRASDEVVFNDLEKDIENSPGWFMNKCKNEGAGVHRLGGRCAEPNVLRLYGDVNGKTDDNPPKQKISPKTDTAPRMAVWGRQSGVSPAGPAQYFPPCSANQQGWGCQRFKTEFGLKPVGSGDADPTGQDGWQFTRIGNPRKCL